MLEKPISNPERKEPNLIEDRVELWLSIVAEAEIDPETKVALREILERFKDWEKNYNHSLDDAAYYSVSQLLSATEKDSHKENAKALFEDLRDDMWALHREL